jgi:hypothetical protein
VSGLGLREGRLLVDADVAQEPRAPRVEHAAGRRGRRAGISPCSRIRWVGSPCRIGAADSSASVYGWCGPRKHRVGGADLHHAPQVEHGDPVGDVADDAEVVGDEQVGNALVLLQPNEQVQDGGLDRDVERGRWLVAQDQSRVPGERACDGDALLEAAESWDGRASNAGRPAGRRGSACRSARCAVRRACQELRQRPSHDPSHRMAPVERRVPALEHDLQTHVPARSCAGRSARGAARRRTPRPSRRPAW